MLSISNPVRRPTDIPVHVEWPILADVLFQDDLDDAGHAPPGEGAAIALAHLATTTVVVQQLLAERHSWILVARAGGASFADIAASMALPVSAVCDIVARGLIGGVR